MLNKNLLTSIIKYGLWQREDTRLIAGRGGTLDWLIDLRAVFLRPDCLERIVSDFWDEFCQREPHQIAGMETAAIPLLTALLLQAPRSWREGGGLIVRKERKTTGLGKLVEGQPSGLPILLVDDILNSGASAEKARAAIEVSGSEVVELFVVVDFRSRKGLEWQRRTGIKVTSLFTLDDLGLELRQDPPPLTRQYRVVWQRDVSGGNPFHVVPKSAPVVANGLVFRGCDAGSMQAFEAETGNVAWNFVAHGSCNGKGIWSTPAIYDGRLYFGGYNGVFYCIDAQSGQEIWSATIGEWIGSSPLIVPRHGLVCIGVEYERTRVKGSMTALDLATGSRIWEHRTERHQHGSAAYHATRDLVLWGSADHETVACRAHDGEVLWRFPTKRSCKYAPAIDEASDLAAFASFDRSIYLVDVATGRSVGQWETQGICYTTPLFAQGKLFCGSGDHHLYAIDLDTKILSKRLNLGARVFSSPIQLGKSLFVGTTAGKVFEVSLESLEIVGGFQISDAVTNAIAPCAGGKNILVSTAMNSLFCVERV